GHLRRRQSRQWRWRPHRGHRRARLRPVRAPRDPAARVSITEDASLTGRRKHEGHEDPRKRTRVVMAPLRSSRAVAVALVTFATFTDLIAYSVAVPVLPDLSRRLGASPTTIGLLFGSFGVTLLLVSIPIGAVSDRTGRRAPLAGGMLALAAATVLFAYADALPLLFAARLVQGAADGVTWVVGFALIADCYGPAERGRVSGIV